jgi:hypothetical protein
LRFAGVFDAQNAGTCCPAITGGVTVAIVTFITVVVWVSA